MRIIRSKRATALFALLAIILPLILVGTSAVAHTTPFHVHLSWPGDPHTTMGVTWATDDVPGDYAASVQYGTAPGSYTASVTGDNYTYPGAIPEMHFAQITGLSADTRYYYRCGNQVYGWSAEYSFATPPSTRKGFKFCAFADSRNPLEIFGIPVEEADNEDFAVWGDMAAEVAAENPIFSIFMADFVYDGGSESEWNQWFDKFEPLGPKGAFLACHGNHEDYADPYPGRFAFPGDEYTYSYDVANVHFTCLDSGNSDDEPEKIQEQVSWLDADLAAARRRGVDWLVVFFHRPPYATGSHGNQDDIINGWVPILEKHLVDVVFCGHNHYYERSYPLKQGEVVEAAPDYYYETGGTVYATAGTVGAPRADTASGDWVASSEKVFHYCTVEVTPDRRMVVTTKRRDGTQLDRFTLAKNNTPVLTAVLPPTAGVGETVTLVGDRFGVERSGSFVSFGERQAEKYASWSDRLVTVEVPGGISGTVDVKVSTASGASNPVAFTVASDVPQPPLPDPEMLVPRRWYFAEGTCRPGFDPYICIQNPTEVDSEVRITYMLGTGENAEQSIAVPKLSRQTVRVKDRLGEGDDPAHDFSVSLEASTGVIAERPMYFNYRNMWTDGHDVLGADSPMGTWYFAEGCTREVTGANFHTWLCLQNPGEGEADVKVTYMLSTGQNIERQVKVPGRSRQTLCANHEVSSGKDLSVRVESSSGVIAERPMYFSYGKEGWTGGHCVMGATAPSRAFYFAEGTCRPGFDTYLCVQNPGESEAEVKVTYMLGTGENVEQAFRVPARSRFTVSVKGVLGEGDDSAHDFSTRVEASTEIIAERPVYFKYAGAWGGGHCVVGASAPQNVFFFAEGTCRPRFDPFICLQNPGDGEAQVKVTYMLGDGSNVEKSVTVRARSRYTMRVKDTLGEADDAAHDFSARIDSDVPVVAERPMYFDYAAKWTGGHCIVGYTPED